MNGYLYLLGYRKGVNYYSWRWHEDETPMDVKLSIAELPKWKQKALRDDKETCDYYIIRRFGV